RGQQLLLLALAALLLLAGIEHLNLVTRDAGASAHARFLFPAIAATSLFLVLGLWQLPTYVRAVGLAALLSASIAATGFSLSILPSSFGPIVPVYGDLDSAQAQQRVSVNFDEARMSVQGWNLEPRSDLRPGGRL